MRPGFRTGPVPRSSIRVICRRNGRPYESQHACLGDARATNRRKDGHETTQNEIHEKRHVKAHIWTYGQVGESGLEPLEPPLKHGNAGSNLVGTTTRNACSDAVTWMARCEGLVSSEWDAARSWFSRASVDTARPGLS